MGRRRAPPLTRDEVVAAAVAIVITDGADALGVSRVARELGIKPPSIYNHVGKGDALPKAVVAEGNRRLLEVQKLAVAEVTAPADRLRSLALATRLWVHDNGGLYTLMARVEPDFDDPEYASVAREMLALFADPMGELGVAEDERIHALRTLRSALHGFALLETAGQFQLPENIEASYEWMIDAILRGAERSTD